MWFKVDDQFHSHPKTLAAGNAAVGLWVRLGSWCAAHLTDGRVPKQVLTLFDQDGSGTRSLVDCGYLVENGDDTFSLHDFLEYQPSRKARKSLAKKRSAAGKQGGSKPKANRKQNGELLPSKGTGRDGTGSRKKRAPHLCPDDWSPGGEVLTWARDELGMPEVVVVREAAAMRDWSRGSGKRKADWSATFRNWLRRRSDDLRGSALPMPVQSDIISPTPNNPSGRQKP